MRAARLHQINAAQIKLAGPRFFPGIEAGAPNLRIPAVGSALDAIGFSPAHRSRIAGLRDALVRAIEQNPGAGLDSLFRGRSYAPAALLNLLADLQSVEPGKADPLITILRRYVPRAGRRLSSTAADLSRRGRSLPDGDKKRSRLDYRAYALRGVLAPLEAIGDFLDSPASHALCTNVLLLTGQWGTGKTHSLCDQTEVRMRQGLPTLLHLAHALPPGDPIAGLCEATKIAPHRARLLSGLNTLGRRRGGRALLILDAINEGDREAWRRSLPALSKELIKYPFVGLVLSCRSPFEKLIAPPTSRVRAVRMQHPGFAEVEFDAQIAYFGHYGIPAPQYPLLVAEFQRPLFLRLFCEAERDLSLRQQHRHLREIASGQKGMTYLLEHFVKQIGKRIEDDLGLARRFCWEFLKGKVLSSGMELGVAPAMARAESDDLLRTTCLDLLSASGIPDAGRRDTVLRRMVSEGLLIETLGWDDVEPRIALPFQRFSDHLVARYLLGAHLDARSPATLRASLEATTPLGRLFVRAPNGWMYARPSLASAIILEFPERARKVVSAKRREIYHYLPQTDRGIDWAPFIDPFLEGLPWRHRASFSESTDVLVGAVLDRGSDRVRSDAFEILVGLASRVGHPYSGLRLWRYLSKLPMADRDLTWSEFIRNLEGTATLYRVLAWAESGASAAMTESSARALLGVLPLFLTSTRRPLRDRVTQALFLAGLRYPRLLFEVTLRGLAFNDPYLAERLLAASYGVAMCQAFSPEGDRVRSELPAFARALIAKVFLPGAPHKTRHTLAKDAALGLIELAERVAPGTVPPRHRRFLRPPYAALGTPFRPSGRVSDAECAAVEKALHMDFNNYTLGRLAPDRANYDSGHARYVRIRRQVLGRMHDLGYSEERFGDTDRMIGERHWNSREPFKTDRYGKKYSWIAYFEMYGLLQDRRLLATGRRAERSSDCDLDPSFPEPAPAWQPRLKDCFPAIEDAAWYGSGPEPLYRALWQRASVGTAAGPWVLLDAFVGRDGPRRNDPRRLITFIQSVLVKEADFQRLKGRLHDVEYVGNAMPRIPSDYYTFAGEIPWSRRFGRELRNHEGVPRPCRELMFYRYEDSRRVGGVNVELPVRDYAWESYHSSLNAAAPLQFPAPALCEVLGLRRFGRRTDMFDPRGRLATVYRTWPELSHGFRSHALYIRADLLRKYLEGTRQRLVWIIWGERQLIDRDFRGAPSSPAIDRIHKEHSNAYRHVSPGP